MKTTDETSFLKVEIESQKKRISELERQLQEEVWDHSIIQAQLQESRLKEETFKALFKTLYPADNDPMEQASPQTIV